MSEQTISAEKLCMLTGITDRRHRQIAKLGFFPPPIKSQYQLTPTLQGLFKYYRELGESKKRKREEIDTEKHRKLKLENDETEGRLTDTHKLAEAAAPLLARFRDMIYEKLEHNAPTAMAKVDVATARIIGRRHAAELLTKMQEAFRQWRV